MTISEILFLLLDLTDKQLDLLDEQKFAESLLPIIL
jgi:hypothetical protein